ncbi:MAG: nucleoside triphosphate pyrophosphohydrolase [Chitinophagales bacterium]|nr:nucleoside triphosphate pyrophosphohydrolase [Chitinophagales bacterium]
MSESAIAFERLLEIMNDLRAKCPWDMKQTTQSLRKLTIEETYELSEAILENDSKAIKEELGDLFLHLVFYSKIAQEQNEFTVAEVLNGVCEKLIFRHPHIYGDVEVADEEEVKRNWEQLKLKEGKKSILEGVPNGLPAMNKAQRVQEKVKQVGFDWDNSEQVFEKIHEELSELKIALQNNDTDEIEDELGDVLFSIINLARFKHIDAEAALEKTNKKFIKRFQWMENNSNKNNLNLQDMSIAELEALWQQAKQYD